jgi:hypothetical protein
VQSVPITTKASTRSLIHIFAIPDSGVTVRFMVLNATFNNISFMQEETKVPEENH